MRRVCARCGQDRLVALNRAGLPICHDCNVNRPTLDELRREAEAAARRQADQPGVHPRDQDGRLK